MMMNLLLLRQISFSPLDSVQEQTIGNSRREESDRCEGEDDVELGSDVRLKGFVEDGGGGGAGAEEHAVEHASDAAARDKFGVI